VLQLLRKRGEARLVLPIVGGKWREHADATYPLALLCARGERPRSRRPAEQRDELAPSYVEHGASPPLRAGGQ
jgi:hypothetical protein